MKNKTKDESLYKTKSAAKQYKKKVKIYDIYRIK